MTGYQIFEYKNTNLISERGISVFEFRFGIMDFLRELNREHLVIPTVYKASIYGLDEVLYFFEADKNNQIALHIKKTLSKSASELHKRCASIQFICKGKLIPGSNLRLEYRGKILPIDLIFGTPLKDRDINNNEFYKSNFSLT